MKILLVGSGGREHALAWKIAQSPLVTTLYAAPGSDAMADLAERVDIPDSDVDALARFAGEAEIDLVIVGPEVPLSLGLADLLAARGIACFGPGKAAAQLESSKGFVKTLCEEEGIPTAKSGQFSDVSMAQGYLRTMSAPYVIKADGLAAGKGVVIADTLDVADVAVSNMLGGQFGSAGASVVIEEFLDGEEASFFVLTDGERALPLIAAQDHKRAFDGDLGPNTGGMGAYSPAPVWTRGIEAQVMEEIIMPTIRAMAARGTPYRGVLYAGLMIGAEGPKLIEYNARFGDPECQVLMRRLRSDIVPALKACADGDLSGVDLDWFGEACALLVMAADGYPGAYEKGSEIKGSDAAAALADVEVFHAGTRIDDGVVRANGGRVLNITATGGDGRAAIARAYEAAALIDWPEGFYRRDIGWRLLERD